jgi:predicted amidohydrolase YtcJ
MSWEQEVVLSNAVLWAHTPMGKIRGGMRIRDGKILEIFNQGSASSGKGSSGDLEGMHVIPGLIDAHRHFFISALLPIYGDASSWTSKEDALGAIEAACRLNRSDNRWVFFSGFDHTRWKIPSVPRLKEIDAAAHGLPVLVVDTTCHRGLISTEALNRTGMSRNNLRCPIDIDIYRNGAPKGTVWEDALGKVLITMYREVFQTYSEEEKRKIILDEAARCLQKGLTQINDPGVPSDIQRLLKDAQKHTPLKISWSVTANDSIFAPPHQTDEADALNSDHTPKSVKFFLDGAYRTAATMPLAGGLKATIRAAKDSITSGSFSPFRMLFEQKITLRNGKLYVPYLRFEDFNYLVDRAKIFTDKGYRLVLHALGNVAARQAAELIKKLKPVGASVEHLLVMDNEDLDIFAGCGAVASLQPGFIPYYADSIERQGAIPYLKAFPLRSLLNRGVAICISSDGPCAADDPLYNIRRAVDRKKPDGSMFDPEERLSELQALSAGTIGGSDSLGLKNDGLCEGAAATFCVVDGDPFLDTSRVVQTWIDGKRAY